MISNATPPLSTNYEKMRLDYDNGVAIITLDRPQKLNSFDSQMAEELIHALDAIKDCDVIRAVVLTGEGQAFSAGEDLAECTVPGVLVEDLIEKKYNVMIRCIRSLPKPVIAVVNGVAAGAGANIAYACDLTFAAESAVFIQSFICVGLIPDSGGTFTIPHLVGMQHAFGQMALADKLTATEAARIGMIWKAVPDHILMEEALKVAHKLSIMPTFSIALIKQALNRSQGSTLDDQLDVEHELQALAGRSSDSKEGIAAFLAKRKPNFIGS